MIVRRFFYGDSMPAALHHLIIATTDREEMTTFLQDLLELSEPWENGFFQSFELADGVVINIAAPPVDEIQPQHYAFLIDEAHFDRIQSRFDADGTEYWADPPRTRPNEFGPVNTDGTGRRLYFMGPDRYMFEVITARYDDIPAVARST